jgi:predicted permease
MFPYLLPVLPPVIAMSFTSSGRGTHRFAPTIVYLLRQFRFVLRNNQFNAKHEFPLLEAMILLAWNYLMFEISDRNVPSLNSVVKATIRDFSTTEMSLYVTMETHKQKKVYFNTNQSDKD